MSTRPPRKKKTIASMKHAVKKKTINKAMSMMDKSVGHGHRHRGTSSSMSGGVASNLMGGCGPAASNRNHVLGGRGGVATNAFLREISEEGGGSYVGANPSFDHPHPPPHHHRPSSSSSYHDHHFSPHAGRHDQGGGDWSHRGDDDHAVAAVNPHDAWAVGRLVCRVLPGLLVDPRSIGGSASSDDAKKDAANNAANVNLLLPTSSTPRTPRRRRMRASIGFHRPGARGGGGKDEEVDETTRALTNECLLSLRVGRFSVEGGTSSNAGGFPKIKAKNKLRYVCVVRSTNRVLANFRETDKEEEEAPKNEDDADPSAEDENKDDGDVYDAMYTEYNSTELTTATTNANVANADEEERRRTEGESSARWFKRATYNTRPDKDETSSFPHLICLAIHADGTSPDVRKAVDLSTLVSVTTVAGGGGGGGGLQDRGHGGARRSSDVSYSSHQNSHHHSSSDLTVRLRFRNGETVDVSTDLTRGGRVPAVAAADGVRRERLLWSLLQIHSILCASVVERHVTAFGRSQAATLPPVATPDVDRAELQYLSTLHGFLSDAPVLCALLERERRRDHDEAEEETSRRRRGVGGEGGETGATTATDRATDDPDKTAEGGDPSSDAAADSSDVNGVAYDMMMGNYSSAHATRRLFRDAREERDAAEVLNAAAAHVVGGGVGATDPSAAADALTELLRGRMRDLEAETCRRLIAWEDEKRRNDHADDDDEAEPEGASGADALAVVKTTKPDSSSSVDALSLVRLFSTLERLDRELADMETWLEGRALAIRPLTDDCREIEEENRQLEQHCRSYDALGQEMTRLLEGLRISDRLQKVLDDPVHALPFVSAAANEDPVHGNAVSAGVDLLHEAGTALAEVLQRAERGGGRHLRAIRERAAALATTRTMFCEALSMIAVRIMETLATDIVERTGSLEKDDAHGVVVRKIKDTQRRFQASFLVYKRLLEVVAVLRPENLAAIRKGYADLVQEGILSKKRMKTYFHSLPMKSCTGITSVSLNLKDYAPCSLKSSHGGGSTSSKKSGADNGGPDHLLTASLKPVNSRDIEMVLSEMMPLITREAFFTSAMFGSVDKNADSARKKRNFEAARRSVDHSTAWFRYYVARVLGITTEAVGGQSMDGDPMLSLVGSIRLAETMENYLDRQKKGGDHALSLAYARATIMDFKRGVETQWVSWVEDEIKWIRRNEGVPLNGKRAGVFASFLRFPSYLDHVLLCFSDDRRSDKSSSAKHNVPRLTKMKTISHYLQKMAGALFASLNECSTRDTTDQQYAASVMNMENTYFFTQSIKNRGAEIGALFARQVTAAHSICKDNMDSYLGWMIKREFKQLHSLFSSISSIRKEVGDADVPIHVPRSTFVGTLRKESNRDVMTEKITTIYARMEKHLSEAGRLLPVAWKALVKVLYEWFGRWEKLSTKCYSHVLSPSAIDMVRIAKNAGGPSVRRPQGSSGGGGKGSGGSDSHNGKDGGSHNHHNHGSNGSRFRTNNMSAAAENELGSW